MPQLLTHKNNKKEPKICYQNSQQRNHIKPTKTPSSQPQQRALYSPKQPVNKPLK